MEKTIVDSKIVVSHNAVRKAAQVFARALVETPQYTKFEEAADRLGKDKQAQEAINAYQTRQQSLRMMMMLNAVSPEEQAELERLQEAFLAEPSVTLYLQAQQDLVAVCSAAAGILSQHIGLPFAAACGPGCGCH